METMFIKKLADKLNISTRTIRFYEEKGLISPAKQSESGYRLFSEKEAWRLQTIISLREIGLAVDDIKSILTDMDKGDKNEVLYSLEIQRNAMFGQWLQLRANIDTTDRMIESLKNNNPLAWEEIFELAEGSKKMRERRKNWKDQWDFDSQASRYDEQVSRENEGFNIHENYEEALDMTLHWVNPVPEETGLDIGIGTGNLAARFSKQGVVMKGVDQSMEMLKQCDIKHPDIETKLGNFLALPYMDGSFDFIVTSYALHHLTDDQKVMALVEMKRVLKAGGRICLTDLMFENQQTKHEYYQMLRQQKKPEIIDAVEDEYFADRSVLLHWFNRNGYVTECKQLNDILHMVYAVPEEK